MLFMKLAFQLNLIVVVKFIDICPGITFTVDAEVFEVNVSTLDVKIGPIIFLPLYCNLLFY